MNKYVNPNRLMLAGLLFSFGGSCLLSSSITIIPILDYQPRPGISVTHTFSGMPVSHVEEDVTKSMWGFRLLAIGFLIEFIGLGWQTMSKGKVGT